MNAHAKPVSQASAPSSAPSSGVSSAAYISSVSAIEKQLASFANLTEKTVDTDGIAHDVDPGITRLGYTALEREAHEVFAKHMRELGAEVIVDTAGNTIATLNSKSKLPAIGTGSHLDSVPAGGRFDGIVGVVGAMEVAQIVATSGQVLQRPWKFVAFANEEGARFGQACNGSRAIAGLSTVESIQGVKDKSGTTLYQAMQEVDLNPDALADSQWKSKDWHAFVELHVEQGHTLQERKIEIGVVDSISGSTRLKVTLTGVASHTGATPMLGRKDALVAASECVIVCEELANDTAHHGTRITIGYMNISPNSTTTIPGVVEFIVDIRDFDTVRQRETALNLITLFNVISDRRQINFDAEIVGDTSPVMLADSVVATVAATVKDLGYSYTQMPSGASHDSQQIAHITDVGMIFVPSRDGLSHVPEEWTESSQILQGIHVLTETLKALDNS